jgi:hypothetical protein
MKKKSFIPLATGQTSEPLPVRSSDEEVRSGVELTKLSLRSTCAGWLSYSVCPGQSCQKPSALSCKNAQNRLGSPEHCRLFVPDCRDEEKSFITSTPERGFEPSSLSDVPRLWPVRLQDQSGNLILSQPLQNSPWLNQYFYSENPN